MWTQYPIYCSLIVFVTILLTLKEHFTPLKQKGVLIWCILRKLDLSEFDNSNQYIMRWSSGRFGKWGKALLQWEVCMRKHLAISVFPYTTLIWEKTILYQTVLVMANINPISCDKQRTFSNLEYVLHKIKREVFL